ncbi:MAG: hypothetical protein PVG39_22790 [Desulfobacteraceae bacterium]|jgi:glutathione synthase/RimK-type ligase-like ATP-grasp enzyme
MKSSVYLFYSGATDKTGSALAEALDISGGTKAPGTKKKIVIGWGAKTKEATDLGNATVLNHPDRIRDNRNKFKALEIMRACGVNVEDFVAASDIMVELKKPGSKIKLPLIARTNYHQGGVNFFTCLTPTHIAETIDALNNILGKKGYFQNCIDIQTEYRLHIVNGKLIYAQKKVPRDNMKQAYVEDQSDKIKRMAKKKGKKLDEDTLKAILDYQGSKIKAPDMVIKSNTRGYKFSRIKPENVNQALLDEAIKSVEAIGLQFGAVDCALDANGKAWIIEVNTGPGLSGTSFKKYVEAFTDVINNILSPPKVTAKKKVSPKTITKAADGAEDKTVTPKQKKMEILAQMFDEMVNNMVECADSADEKETIKKVAKKMWS